MKLRGVVASMAAAMACAGVLVAHVWKQNRYVEMSRESYVLKKEIVSLRDSIAASELEVGDLRKTSRLERLGREVFGLAYSGAPIPVYGKSVERKGNALAKLAFWRNGTEWSGSGL